ncbi:MAG TPA: alpha/beta hydrolase, partial [Magnetococcales bacterium]|nr:alpha/beta hydrolase [Magnetococcales bacterium]
PDIKKRIHAVVLEGTFSSYRVIAQEKMADLWFAWSFQWLPNLTLSDHYAAKTSVPLITDIPLLLVHGCADTTIPCEHSKRLLTLAGSLGELWLPENVEHTQAFRTPEKQKQLLKWLENTTPSGQKK